MVNGWRNHGRLSGIPIKGISILTHRESIILLLELQTNLVASMAGMTNSRLKLLGLNLGQSQHHIQD